MTLNARTLETFGTTTFTGSNSFQMQGATIINESAATWNLQNGTIASSSGTNTFQNEGMLTGTGTIGVPLNNTGTVDPTSGTLSLTGTIAQLSGVTLSGGTWEASGGILRGFSGGITSDSATIIGSGAGSNFYTGTSGTTNALATLTGITGAGSLSLQGGFNLTVATLANAGSVAVGAGSTLSATNAYTQSGGTTNRGRRRNPDVHDEHGGDQRRDAQRVGHDQRQPDKRQHGRYR